MAIYRSTLAVCIMLHQTKTFISQKTYDCDHFIKVKLVSSDKPMLLQKLFNASVYSPASVPCFDVHLISEAPNRHVCLQQLKQVWLSHDIPSTLDLQVFDDRQQFRGVWDTGEHCTSSHILTARLLKYNTLAYKYKKDELNGLTTSVYDIRTPHRLFYTIQGFCDSDVKLYNSRIIIYDKYLTVVKNGPRVTVELCAIHFFNIPNENPFCVEYTIRPRELGTLYYWKVFLSPILVYDYERLKKESVYSFDAESNLTASWCDSVVRDKLTLVYKTTKIKFFDYDPPLFEMYLYTEKPQKYKSTTERPIENKSIPKSTKDTPDTLASTTDKHKLEITTPYRRNTISIQTSPNISPIPDKNSKIIFYSFVACLVFVMVLSIICYLAKPRKKPKNQGEEMVLI